MNNIKKLRRTRKMNQKQLAEIINVHQTRISDWEMGKSSPDNEQAEMLAEFFNVSVGYLLGKTNDRYDYRYYDPDMDRDLAVLDDYEREIISIYRTLEQQQKHHLYMTAKMLEKFYIK